MLFNSQLFLLGFLPPVVASYYLVHRHVAARLWFLIAASLVFYGYWDVRFLPFLAISVIANWVCAWSYYRSGRRAVLYMAIAGDLLGLGFFKYLDFFVVTLNGATGMIWPTWDLALPLGISFFTFHHVMYLADLAGGRAPRYTLRDYALYIVLFPQLLAGPLVRYSEIVHQYVLDPMRPGWAERCGRGLVLLTIGLVKKVFIADRLAALADPLFAAAGQRALGFAEAWNAALAFTFQIYFDFSGYSDMAIGLALLFGFVLPINFNAPYRALSLRDFWQRWHMTLSRFLRDYLYIPFGGNRNGLSRQIAALGGTMLLGGLWHGAGFNFILWGGLHGAGLGLRVLAGRAFPALAIPSALSWLMTFVFVVVCWIFFRVHDLGTGIQIVSAMTGFGGWEGSFRSLGLIAVAAAVSILGPTSQEFALTRLPPRVWAAGLCAVVAMIVLLRLGDAGSNEFIYFRF